MVSGDAHAGSGARRAVQKSLRREVRSLTGVVLLLALGTAVSLAADSGPDQRCTLSGRVTDAEGEPVARAKVRAQPKWWSSNQSEREDKTGPDGRFEMRRMHLGGYQVAVSARGFAHAARDIKLTGDCVPLEIVLDRGTTLYVRVTELTPDEVKQLGVRARWPDDVEYRDAASEGDRFRLDRIPAGRVEISAHIEGLWISQEIDIETGESERSVTIEFPRRYRVTGSVRIDGRPTDEGSLSLTARDSSESIEFYDHHTGSPADFEFRRVPEGTHRLGYFGPFGGHEREVVVEGDTRISLDLSTGTIRGRVVDPATSSPMKEVEVDAYSDYYVFDTGHEFSATTGAEGVFELGPLLHGNWRLIARFGTLSDGHTEISLDSALETVDLGPEPTGRLELQVTSDSSHRPSELKLTLYGDKSDEEKGIVLDVKRNQTAIWDPAPLGSWRLVAWAGDSCARADVEIPGPPVELHFAAAGALRVRVPDLELEDFRPDYDSPEPILFATLIEDSDDEHEPICRSSRALFMRNLQPGRWQVEVRLDDGRAWSGTTTIEDGRRSELILD